MCIFSRSVRSVAKTRIFARAIDRAQELVYSMTFSAAEDLAMILPLPVKQGAREGNLRFISLERYEGFFSDLKSGFPEAASASRSTAMLAMTPAPLAVVEVGSFEASFVPSVKDFARLDARFRLPEDAWDQLPQYQSYGFAVFKLKKDAHTVHPMAFEFPRSDAGKLFFPTVHVHDGTVHPEAKFDHELYCQVGRKARLDAAWRKSDWPARVFMKLERAEGLIDPEEPCYLRRLQGRFPNRDTLV